VRRPVVLLAALSVGLLSLTPSGAAPVLPVVGSASNLSPLIVSGNKIIDASGATVTLRGIHRDGTEGGPSTSPTSVSDTEIGFMGAANPGSWHATVIRVPVGSAQWTGLCPTLAFDTANYKAAIDAEVKAINAQGAVALIDLHSSTADCTRIDRHAMPDATVTKAFWSDAAQHFALQPRVAFELYNEPHDVSDDTWLHGTTGKTVQDCDPLLGKAALTACRKSAPKYQAVGMQELYDLVSKAAPLHLVVVAPGYAASLPTLRVNATNGELVYAFHPYTCSNPGAACDTKANAHANLRLLKSYTVLAKSSPIFITEFGWPVYAKGYGLGYVDGSAYYRETIAFLERQTPAWGWVAFAFDGNDGGGFSLLKDKTTYVPNSTGKPVYDALRSHV
jgi:hypothetical protein